LTLIFISPLELALSQKERGKSFERGLRPLYSYSPFSNKQGEVFIKEGHKPLLNIFVGLPLFQQGKYFRRGIRVPLRHLKIKRVEERLRLSFFLRPLPLVREGGQGDRS
jgi:hypothetical protein